jgi:Prenyltransferase and squalene oxidase repeat
MASISLLLAAGLLGSDVSSLDADIRAALDKSLPLLTKGADGHMAKRTCFACHNQGIPILAMATLRAGGMVIDEEALAKNMKFINAFLDQNRANYLQGKGQGGQADTAGYALWSLELGGWRPNETTAAVAEYLLQHQRDLPAWRATSNRPPSEASPFTTSFLALRGLQTFGTVEQRDRVFQRTRNVRAWLLKTPGKDTEDRVFRMWGLKVAGAHPLEVQRAAQELLQTQRPDGGWSQIDKLESDAYATGSALVALHEAAGLATDSPAYQRGVRFLLKTQRDNGSWFVHSRSKPFQLYYESGFPHGPDQFISIAASGWATAALALAARGAQ